mgnify:CR=1 FL=1|tara:strand:+ start:51 stop:692 length:642 start_codon:yes stop_codon:yes gene_type:complete
MSSQEPKHINNTGNLHDDVVLGDRIKTLLQAENTRLNNKKSGIESAMHTKYRQDKFQESETGRNNANMKILYTVLVTIIICFLWYYLNYYFPFLPQTAYEVGYILIITVSFIYLINQYMDIQKRSRMDFNKIDFAYLLDEEKIKDPNAPSSDVLTRRKKAGTEECTGKDCCPASNSIFKDNKCMKLGETFQTMNKSIQSDFKSFSERPTYSSL